jgi:hypothetical protein
VDAALIRLLSQSCIRQEALNLVLLPKDSAKGEALAAKAFLNRYLEEVPLTPDEQQIVKGDLKKLEVMLDKLKNVPTLDGRTPRFNRRFYPFNAFRSLLGIAGDVVAPTYAELYSGKWTHPSCSSNKRASTG